jgi:hypothetical protein
MNMDGEDATKVKEVMVKEKLNWRTFVDRGPISDRWKPPGTPTFILIDHKGLIRKKWAGGPSEKALDSALEKLLTEAEEVGKKRSR